MKTQNVPPELLEAYEELFLSAQKTCLNDDSYHIENYLRSSVEKVREIKEKNPLVQRAILKLKHEKLERSVWVPGVISLMETVDKLQGVWKYGYPKSWEPMVHANEQLAKAILGEGKGRLVTEKEFRNEALGVRDES